MTSIIAALIPVALNLIEYFLSKNKEDKEMQALFYRFVEKFAGEYLNSKKLRDHASKQLAELDGKPFQETV